MRILAILCALVLLTSCSGHSSTPTPSPTSTPVPTVRPTPTRSPSPTPFVASRPAPVGNFPPGGPTPPGETLGNCPYISTADAQTAQGNHIYKTTTLGTTPVTCRFYFYAPPYNAVLEIAPSTFATATDAHNAMVLTAQTTEHPDTLQSYPGFAPGVDLISFQTYLYAPDKGSDWATVFTKGTTMVLVRTQEAKYSQNARNVAALIVGSF